MIRTRVLWTGVAGTPYYSNFFWIGTGAADANSAAAKTAQYVAHVTDLVSNKLTLQAQPEAVELSVNDGSLIQAFAVTPQTRSGQDAGEPLPFQTQMRATLSTASVVGGRRLRGTNFIGGLTETEQSTGIGPSEAIRAAMQGVLNQYLLASGGALLGVWSRKNGVINGVTAIQVNPIWSTLRSRRPV